MEKKETVFIGLSGGVDSSVAAKRLLEQGYTVVGVFIKTWQPEFIQCNWEAERLDAMRVAAHLNIPFLTCDAEEAYKMDVADYMISEYQKGRTPNPDVMCNRYVKFGAFLAFAQAHGAHTVATGHYARIEEHDGRYALFRGRDAEKDQSYFLWTLTQEQLACICFPVGDSSKKDIRHEAVAAGLPTAQKQDSQGVCFLGEIDMQDFLSHYIETAPGNVLNEHGAVIGTHEGALYYTLGQRHGFAIHNAGEHTVPLYVVSKSIAENTITVAPEPRSSIHTSIILTDMNCMLTEMPPECEAQFRYRQKPFRVKVEIHEARATLTVLDTGIDMPSLGQSCVLYEGERCIGGGIIDSVHHVH